MSTSFDFAYALKILPGLLRATLVTVEATGGGMGIALLLGLAIVILRIVSPRIVSIGLTILVEMVRSTPLLVQLFIVFYVLPEDGITLSPMAAGLAVIGVQYSAYLSEVYRSGIEAVPRGQWEAAVALNYASRHQWTRIILPQAIPPILPVLGNYVIAMLKDTPALALIGVQELLGTALTDASHSFRYVEPVTLVGIIFIALSCPASIAMNRLQRRLAARRQYG